MMLMCKCNWLNLGWSVYSDNSFPINKHHILRGWFHTKMEGMPVCWKRFYPPMCRLPWLSFSYYWTMQRARCVSVHVICLTVLYRDQSLFRRSTVYFDIWLVANQIGFLHKNSHSGCNRPTRWWNETILKHIHEDEKDAKNFIFGDSCYGFVRFGLQQAIWPFSKWWSILSLMHAKCPFYPLSGRLQTDGLEWNTPAKQENIWFTHLWSMQHDGRSIPLLNVL